ncbi:site-specific integrase [Streptomyces sioyaensis]|uniref:tyrosine-type recombinase/integrase n=1 Tax=Streptomyces sioyaensis TaxID=67364 RepID=UPI00340514AC
MAYIQERKRTDGEVSYTVRWRAGGAREGKNESEVFTDEEMAKRFRDLVSGHGEQWPPGWIRGRGFIADLRSPDEMFESWAMKQIDLLTGVQDDTKAKYKRLVEQNMSPWFKPYSVRDGEGGIKREMVQRWVNDLKDGVAAPLDPPDRKPRRKYAPKTIANQHGLLHAILQAAVDAEQSLRATNPCAFTKLPRLDGDEIDEEMVFLEREEFAWIHECMAEDAQDLTEAFGETGGRWGEVTALQPRDLRIRNGRPTIRIQRAWKRDGDGKPYLGAPKTKRSRRTAVVTWGFFRRLQARAKGKVKDALLFTGPNGGRWDAGTFRRLRWVPAIELAAEKFGLIKRPRIHDLRHSHAAWMIAAKVPLPAIQRRLGHESITTTVDRYGHLLDALDDEVMAAVAWAMDPTSPLPGFLLHPGLPENGEAPRAIPRQRQESVMPHGVWHDASGVSTTDTGRGSPVFVIRMDGREIAFADRDHAHQVREQWNADADFEALRAAGWSEGELMELAATGPEERFSWTGTGRVWDRMPDRRFVYYQWAEFQPDGSSAQEPTPLQRAWIWEFEDATFTTKPAEWMTGHRAGRTGLTEAQARGTNREAVQAAFDLACGQARAAGQHSQAEPATAVA